MNTLEEMISENQRPRSTTMLVIRDSTAPPDTMLSLVSTTTVRWTRQRVFVRVSFGVTASVGSLDVTTSPLPLGIIEFIDPLATLMYAPLSETLGNEHTVDLDDS